MRRVVAIAAFAALAITAPASAQSDAVDALESLDNPGRVEAMASALEGITAAMLAMPVGPLVDAIRSVDPYDNDLGADLPPDATLADVAGSNPDMPARLGEEMRVTGSVAGAAARDLATALPMLTAITRDLAAQWDQRMADARRDRR